MYTPNGEQFQYLAMQVPDDKLGCFDLMGEFCLDKKGSLLSGPRSHGLVVRAVACEARGPGFNSSSDQMFFFSPRV